MVQLKISLAISIALFMYYVVLQLYSYFSKTGMATNTKNKRVAKLMTEYKVNIRTFQRNNGLDGSAWFKTIWINESLFRYERLFMFTFYHEYYHLTHRHRQWTLFIRFLYSLTPLLLSIFHWLIFLLLFISLAGLIDRIMIIFENNANAYAEEKLSGHS